MVFWSRPVAVAGAKDVLVGKRLSFILFLGPVLTTLGPDFCRFSSLNISRPAVRYSSPRQLSGSKGFLLVRERLLVFLIQIKKLLQQSGLFWSEVTEVRYPLIKTMNLRARHVKVSYRIVPAALSAWDSEEYLSRRVWKASKVCINSCCRFESGAMLSSEWGAEVSSSSLWSARFAGKLINSRNER